MKNKVFVIESAPPIVKEKRGPKSIYPFADLKAGQSFFVDEMRHKAVATLKNTAKIYGYRHNVKLAVQLDFERHGVHVIRVE